MDIKLIIAIITAIGVLITAGINIYISIQTRNETRADRKLLIHQATLQNKEDTYLAIFTIISKVIMGKIDLATSSDLHEYREGIRKSTILFHDDVETLRYISKVRKYYISIRRDFKMNKEDVYETEEYLWLTKQLEPIDDETDTTHLDKVFIKHLTMT